MRASVWAAALAVIVAASPARANEPAETDEPANADEPAETDEPTKIKVEDSKGQAHTQVVSPGLLHVEHVPVPISANFSTFELVAVGTLAVGDLLSLIFQRQLVDWRGDPAIGKAPAIDESISEAIYSGANPPKWLDTTDKIGGIGVPVAAALFYGSDALVTLFKGEGYSGDVYSSHHFLAFSEAFLINGALVQIAKIGIGRLRPEYALRPGEPPEDSTDASLSFYSGHAATAFCVGSYLYRDLSDYLVSERSWGVWAGRVLPAVVIYGMATTIGYERIADQKHFFSDVLAGALVGSFVGHAIYALHFDGEGHPRHRFGKRIEVVAGIGVVGIRGDF